MNIKQQSVWALLTAILAGVVTYVTQAMAGWPVPATIATGNQLTYISFATWACYFAAGSTIKGALNWLYSMVGGIIAAILMFVLTFMFMPGTGYLLGVSIAVIILVFFMMLLDRIKMNTTAVFIGTALYFALNSSGALTTFTLGDYLVVGAAEIVYTLVGLFAGYLTILFAGWSGKIGAKTEIK